MSKRKLETDSPSKLSVTCTGEQKVSPMTELSSNLRMGLNIKKSLTFEAENSCDTMDGCKLFSQIGVVKKRVRVQEESTGRKRLKQLHSNVETKTKSVSCSLFDDVPHISPSKFKMVHRYMDRLPLVEFNTNSQDTCGTQDSGYSSQSQDTNKFTEYLFARPNVTPKKRALAALDLSPSPARGGSVSTRCFSMFGQDEGFADLGQDGIVASTSGFVKRTSPQDNKENLQFLKRRKPPAGKLRVCSKRYSSGPSSAPPKPVATLFDFGFKKAPFHRSFSVNEDTIKNAVLLASSDSNLIGDRSRSYALPVKTSAKVGDLKNITCDTLAELMDGKYGDAVDSYKIIDCRYPYEYEGGHIRGAVNVFTKKTIFNELHGKTEDKLMGYSSQDKPGGRNIVIFHCEFSSERGPCLSRYLRNEDRLKNSILYPQLDYPEMYLLEGGYSEFYKRHGDKCEPRSYRRMMDSNFQDEFRMYRSMLKNFPSRNNNT